MYRLNRVAVMAVFAFILTGILPWAVVANTESPSSMEQTFQKAKNEIVKLFPAFAATASG